MPSPRTGLASSVPMALCDVLKLILILDVSHHISTCQYQYASLLKQMQVRSFSDTSITFISASQMDKKIKQSLTHYLDSKSDHCQHCSWWEYPNQYYKADKQLCTTMTIQEKRLRRNPPEQTDCHDNDEQSRKKNGNNHKKLLTGAFNNIKYNWGIF